MSLLDDPGTPDSLKISAASKALDLIEGPPPTRVMLSSGEIKTIWGRGGGPVGEPNTSFRHGTLTAECLAELRTIRECSRVVGRRPPTFRCGT
jgi:hypothetical protein